MLTLPAAVRHSVAHTTEHSSGIIITPGTREDLERVSTSHYRTASPVGVERVLLAVEAGTGEVVGALGVSRSPLNDSWRDEAWPKEFPKGLSPRDRAARVNAHVRIISRVVVVPSRRSLSIARDLVKSYLDDPLTRCTEAIAAMGDIVPFFERAGMTRVHLSSPRRDLVLLRKLAQAGYTPLDLAGLDAHPAPILDEVVRALRTWARAHRGTRSRAEADTVMLGLHAATALLSPRLAYTARKE